MSNLFEWIIHIATILGSVSAIMGFVIKWLDKHNNVG